MLKVNTRLFKLSEDNSLDIISYPMAFSDFIKIRPWIFDVPRGEKIDIAKSKFNLKEININGNTFYYTTANRQIYEISYVLGLMGFLLIEKENYAIYKLDSENPVILPKSREELEEHLLNFQNAARKLIGTDELLTLYNRKLFQINIIKPPLVFEPVILLEPLPGDEKNLLNIARRTEFIGWNEKDETQIWGKIASEGRKKLLSFTNEPLLAIEKRCTPIQIEVKKLTTGLSLSAWMYTVGNALFDLSISPLKERIKTKDEEKEPFVLVRVFNIFEIRQKI